MSGERILLAHGGGGRTARDLLEKVIVPVFDNPQLECMEDSSLLPATSYRMVMTTDSYVVKPLFFPGGDIGKLSICGTVNDLATAGANPVALSAGFVIEEGLSVEDLRKIVCSMKETADSIPVPIITGDTKVVERGKGDGIYITTAGIGSVPEGVQLRPKRVEPGDVVLINGPIGNHEAAILCAREDFSLGAPVCSDWAPLHRLMEAVLVAVPETKCARDATRGGLGAVLTEIAESTGYGIRLEEECISIEDTVQGLCELLGMDPLFMANEGRMVILVPEEKAEICLRAMQRVPGSESSRIIGRVHDGIARLTLNTRYGTSRIVTLPAGVQLPRIC